MIGVRALQRYYERRLNLRKYTATMVVVGIVSVLGYLVLIVFIAFRVAYSLPRSIYHVALQIPRWDPLQHDGVFHDRIRRFRSRAQLRIRSFLASIR